MPNQPMLLNPDNLADACKPYWSLHVASLVAVQQLLLQVYR